MDKINIGKIKKILEENNLPLQDEAVFEVAESVRKLAELIIKFEKRKRHDKSKR